MAEIIGWVGSKKNLIKHISHLFPRFEYYCEPFAGSLAIFGALKPSKAYISDLNEDLINMYQVLQNPKDCEKFLKYINVLRDSISERMFYNIRRKFNRGIKNKCAKAAAFLYLITNAYGNLCRYNKNGEFNAPYGKKALALPTEQRLREFSEKLESAHIEACDFEKVLVWATKPNGFVVMDPPYVPRTLTSNFTSYVKDGFSWKDQIRLKKVIDTLTKRGVKVMAFNNAVDPIMELYHGYKLHVINIKKPISVRKNGRAKKVREVVIMNY